MGAVKVWAELIVSLVVGVIGAVSTAGLAGFILGVKVPFFVPNTVNDENSPRLVPGSPVLNNLVLFLAFGIQHSGMLRGPVKYLLSFILSDNNQKVLFVAVTCAYVRFVFYHFWAPMPYALWDIQQLQLRTYLFVTSVLSFFLLVVAQLNLDPWSLLGIRSNLDKVFNRKTEVNFVNTGLYGLVRHPIYSFLMVGTWVTPIMTLGHLMVATIFTAYILFAVANFEEPDLIKNIGPRYQEYMKTTPRYIPNLTSTTSKILRRIKKHLIGKN